MGKVPANLPAPATDPHSLNGFYVPDLGRMMGPPPPGGAPGAAPPAGLPAGSTPGVPPAPPPGSGPAAAPRADQLETTAEMLCRPEAQISVDYGEQIVQTPGRLTFIIENNHIVRRIYLDRQFPAEIAPTYAGFSIGHWDGDTLVIETRAMKATELGKRVGLASVTHMVERVRKLDGGRTVEDVATLDGVDADGKAANGTLRSYLRWRPDLHLQEFVCEGGAGLFFQQ
jgi:hypothetical protein